jgi:hypothetical protein
LGAHLFEAFGPEAIYAQVTLENDIIFHSSEDIVPAVPHRVGFRPIRRSGIRSGTRFEIGIALGVCQS